MDFEFTRRGIRAYGGIHFSYPTKRASPHTVEFTAIGRERSGACALMNGDEDVNVEAFATTLFGRKICLLPEPIDRTKEPSQDE